MSNQKSKKSSILSEYWKDYGGMKKISHSPLFWLSIFMTALLAGSWLNAQWWDDVLSLMPNLLGFSLGGFAMWLAIGDDSFRKLIAGKEKNKISPYMQVNATFAHFLLLQTISILTALSAKSFFKINILTNLYINEIWFYIAANTLAAIGYFIFIYAIFSSIGAIFALYRVSRWYDQFVEIIKSKKEKKSK